MNEVFSSCIGLRSVEIFEIGSDVKLRTLVKKIRFLKSHFLLNPGVSVNSAQKKFFDSVQMNFCVEVPVMKKFEN